MLGELILMLAVFGSVLGLVGWFIAQAWEWAWGKRNCRRGRHAFSPHGPISSDPKIWCYRCGKPGELSDIKY